MIGGNQLKPRRINQMSPSIFIYIISILYGAQAVYYFMNGNPWQGVLVFIYGIAGIPLIMMAK